MKMTRSTQELEENIKELILNSTTIAELWGELRELAARRGKPVSIFDKWLDRLLAKVNQEYGVEGEEMGLKAMRDLALDGSEAVSQAAMELLIAEQQEAVNEIVSVLSKYEKKGDRTPALRIKRLYADAKLPQRATEGATGLDLCAYIRQGNRQITLEEKPKLVGTGIAVEVPKNYDVQIRPRSGLSSKGVMVAFGTVDSDYRGELMVTMYTLGNGSSFAVRDGERIAQMVVTRLAELPVEEVKELSSTKRGSRGHGSTGTV
jgi:dUTP pyrophosphatase